MAKALGQQPLPDPVAIAPAFDPALGEEGGSDSASLSGGNCGFVQVMASASVSQPGLWLSCRRVCVGNALPNTEIFNEGSHNDGNSEAL